MVMDLDEGSSWYCRPLGLGAKATQLCQITNWPKVRLTEMEIARCSKPLRRYIMSGMHPLRDAGCGEQLKDFSNTYGAYIDALCENSIRQCTNRPFSSVLAIGRLSGYYPAEYRVRAMLSFAPLAPDDMLRFLGVVRSEADLLGRSVTLQVLARGLDGSIAPRSIPLAGPETPLELLTGEPLPEAPQMYGAPGSELAFEVDGACCRVKLAELGLPESGLVFTIGLSKEKDTLRCHLTSPALRKPVSAPILPA